MATAEGTVGVAPTGDDSAVTVEADTLFDRLSDDHATHVLHALGVGPRSAAALTERLPVSRATVYRRLDGLVAAELVESQLVIDGDGHHRKQFRLAVEAITVQFGPDGVGVDTTALEPRSTPTTTAVEEPAAVLDVLGDEYTRTVLAAMGEQSLAAREIVDKTGVSRPTVYRRLNRLADLGVVETVDGRSPDGQHRQQYRLAVTEIDISLVDGSAIDDDREAPTASDGHAQPEATAERDTQTRPEKAAEQQDGTVDAREQTAISNRVTKAERRDQPPDTESPITTPQAR